ncbi:MAG: site-specific integrase [Betaproteobacteria bacterium]|nr:site-specific integrase [Betaproteobacteria bacterium]
MATFVQRESGWWQAVVRRRGHPQQSKTFPVKAQAEQWARDVESRMDRGIFRSTEEAERTTLSQVIDSFEKNFAPHHYKHRADGKEAWRFQCAHLRRELGDYSLHALTPPLIAKYRDDRLAGRLSGTTVKKELGMLSKLIKYAAGELAIALPFGNPVTQVRMPREGAARERRLDGADLDNVLNECRRSRNPVLYMAAQFAILTAMRQGELLALDWSWIDLERRMAVLPDERVKNGSGRAVPLSRAAVELLQAIGVKKRGLVFPVERLTLYHAFAAACRRAGVANFTWHDLRHEALSRMAERGDLTVIELASISGHKTMQMLKRYTHLRAGELAKKLDRPPQRPRDDK